MTKVTNINKIIINENQENQRKLYYFKPLELTSFFHYYQETNIVIFLWPEELGVLFFVLMF